LREDLPKRQDVYSSIKFEKPPAKSVTTRWLYCIEMKAAEIPADWSQLATDIAVSKYFRKAACPRWMKRASRFMMRPAKQKKGPEKSVKAGVIASRILAHWGKAVRLLQIPMRTPQAFYDELAHMLLMQKAAPNSPQCSIPASSLPTA